MIKIFRKLEDGINNKVIAFETMAMTKKPGDGHYVAIALGLLIALALAITMVKPDFSIRG